MNPLLPQAELARPAIQALAQLAIGGIVLRQVGVEQIHGYATDHHAPGADADGPAAGGHRRETRLAVVAEHTVEGRERRVEPLVGVRLPAVEPQALIEVPARVQQPDADQRRAQVGCGLAVVSRQDAEPAGVDRQ
jgi:hypothetical protein